MSERDRNRRHTPDEKLAALMDEFEGRLVSPGGAAALLGVSRKTVHTLGKRGVLRMFVSDVEDKWGPISEGPRWVYIPLQDVHAYAARTGRETKPASRWRRWLPKTEDRIA
jgi:hypothetical protein